MNLTVDSAANQEIYVELKAAQIFYAKLVNQFAAPIWKHVQQAIINVYVDSVVYLVQKQENVVQTVAQI